MNVSTVKDSLKSSNIKLLEVVHLNQNCKCAYEAREDDAAQATYGVNLKNHVNLFIYMKNIGWFRVILALHSKVIICIYFTKK